MHYVWLVLKVIGWVFAAYILYTIYLAFVLKWEDMQSRGLGYYGLPPEGRAAFKRRLRLHSTLLTPLIRFNSSLVKINFLKVRVVFRGVSFPLGSVDTPSLERAASYQPRPGDIFVATQMKCGTTWMEHVVYEVLMRGNGNIVDTGITLYSIAPWLEGVRSVSLDEAPVIGSERPSRIIKTHFGANLCPQGANAKFIYVARHPVSCFASCMDFIATNVGRMAPDLATYEHWFTSPDLMWWGTWTDHVKGWWDRSRGANNVLFVHFEEMKKDLAGIVKQVAAFLGVPPLKDDELARVVEKCGFAYMQDNQDNFEMHPPHVLQTNAEMFVAGTADRHKSVPADVKQRLTSWVVAEMKESSYPLARTYPDLTST